MATSHPNGFQDTALAWSLPLAPLALLVSTAVLPALRGTDGTELSVIASHHRGYYVFILFGIIGSVLLVPAFLALSGRVAASRPRLGAAAAILTIVGTCLSLVDWGTELVKWQMVGGQSDRAQMALLADRVDAAPGIAVLLQLSGMTVLVGAVLLAVGLFRAPGFTRWAGIGLPAGIFLNLFGFAAGNIAVLDASGVLLVICMGVLSLRATNYRLAPAA